MVETIITWTLRVMIAMVTVAIVLRLRRGGSADPGGVAGSTSQARFGMDGSASEDSERAGESKDAAEFGPKRWDPIFCEEIVSI